MDSILQDFRLALRLVRKRPTASLVVILTLALGIGATTTFFASFYGMVLRPLPFAEPQNLVSLMSSRPQDDASWQRVSALDYRDVVSESNVFEGAGAYRWMSYNLQTEETPERIAGAAVEASLFPTLGVAPQLGRGFSADDDMPRGPKVALISDALWQRRFDRDPRAIGATLRIDDTPWEIIGVMPDGFRFPNEGHVWTPLALDTASMQRGERDLAVIARLSSGQDAETAMAGLQPVADRLAQLYPQSHRGWSFSVMELHDAWLPPVTQLAMVAQIVLVFGVLLIVCANVANLALAQASVRRQEMALRAALGASRHRLARLTLAESMVLATAGGLVGILASTWSENWMLSISPVTIPYWLDMSADLPVVLFGVALTVLTGFMVGLLPAIKGTGLHLFNGLRSGGGGEDPSRGRLRQGLVVMEYAITVVVLVAGLLMTQSFDNVRDKDQGFAVEDRLTFRLALTGEDYASVDARRTFYEELEGRLEALPGVEAAGWSTHLPISQRGYRAARLEVPGRDTDLTPGPRTTLGTVSAGYLESLDIQLLEGRGFTSEELWEGQPAMLISHRLAEHLWPGEEAVGRQLRTRGRDAEGETGPWHRVVGVVGDVAPGQMLAGLAPFPDFQVYVPAVHHSPDGLELSSSPTFVLAASGGDLNALAEIIKAEVHGVDSTLPVFDLRSMHTVLDRFYFAQKLWSQMFSAIAFLALVIAAVGAYGVTAYSVSQRVRELGIRLALGAERAPLLRLVMRQGVLLAGFGVGLGLAVAIPLAQTLSNLLHDMRAFDLGVFGTVVGLLLAVGTVASFAPAWRAVQMDPLQVLRAE